MRNAQPGTPDPAIDLLYRYTQALDRMAFRDMLKLFDAPARYRVQCRKNFQRNGVLHLVNDNEQELKFRVDSHPPGRLESSIHVLGNARVEERSRGECRVHASFTMDRNGRPTFAGEYRALINEAGDKPLFRELVVILDGESVAGTIQVPI